MNVKQMSRQELKDAGTAEAFNEILQRNIRLAVARRIIREIREVRGAA